MYHLKELLLTCVFNGHPRKLLEIAKIKLLDCKNIYKYTSTYQTAYGQIYSFTVEELDLNIRNTNMLLQAAMLMNIGNKYVRIV